MERVVLNKDTIIAYLKKYLESIYDIELENIELYNLDIRREVILYYRIVYHGKREQVIKSMIIVDFITLLRYALEYSRKFVKPSISVMTDEEIKCRISYRLVDSYSRRRRK